MTPFRSFARASSTLLAATMVCATLHPAAYAAGHGISFGKAKDADVKVDNKGGIFKGQTTVAIGAFRVAFVTEDVVISSSHGAFSNGGSSAKLTGVLSGIDHAAMQKIADRVYADFVKQLTGKGYKVIDSASVEKASGAYRGVPQTVNFADSRLGTLVVPTSQRSVAMAADDSGKDTKGGPSFGSSFHNLGKSMAKSEAMKAFPQAAKDVGAPVLGVTIVVNFANFKGKNTSLGNSKVGIEPGITIEGTNKNELAVSTAILAWDAKSCDNLGCVTRVYLEGNVHSSDPIGDAATRSKKDFYFGTATGTTVLSADPQLYEASTLATAGQVSEMLVEAIAKER